MHAVLQLDEISNQNKTKQNQTKCHKNDDVKK